MSVNRPAPQNIQLIKSWDIARARQYYNLPQWSENYFDLDEQGHLVVRPNRQFPEKTFSLSSICQSLEKKGMQTPYLLRFVDILQDRVASLCEAFNEAIGQADYQGSYAVCYPIKVNQQRSVAESLVASNQKMQSAQVGLEAGSKPELMAVLALSEKTNSLIVCNGYKDREYIRAALIASTMGHTVYLVVEKITELELILNEAEQLNIEPRIGVRARLASKGESKWQDSGGDHSKFGLSASQILRLVERLQNENKLSIFQLLHFHLGSQITTIRDIQNALKECARFYAELTQLNVPISTVDVGGGLGVDYEGTQSRSHCSVNYTLSEYANNVVGAFKEIATLQNLPHPAIITESGRALTAHHAVLIANVIDSEKPQAVDVKRPDETFHFELQQFWDIYQLSIKTEEIRLLVECFHNAEYSLKQIIEMFNHGVVNLAERALAERLHRHVLFQVKDKLESQDHGHDDLLEELSKKLASKFFVNFSIFQSLPDAWAIDQVFPIMPLAGLANSPSETAVLQDITCDSDGMLKQYVNGRKVGATIDLPEFQSGEEYWLGVFMVGAYQEILGDMHNLFGDTHTAELALNEDGELKIVAIEQGDTVEELLDYVDFNAKQLLESYKRQLSKTELPLTCQRQYLAELRQGIYGYSYLED